MMTSTTQLEEISRERASELFDVLKAAHEDEGKAIVLDDQGVVTGVVDVGDPQAQHLLGDLDVHA